MGSPLNIMVVDDTITYRMIMTQALEGMTLPGIEIKLVGTAANGKIALEKIAKSLEARNPQEPPADLLLLDVEMPEMDGLQTLAALKKIYPKIGVVMISGVNEASADITMTALERGAIDFVPKPTGNNSKESFDEIRRRLGPIFKLFNQRLNPQPTPVVPDPAVRVTTLPAPSLTPQAVLPKIPGSSPPPAAPPLPSMRVVLPAPDSRVLKTLKAGNASPRKSGKFSLLAMGISTGGPSALGELLPLLPAGLGVPIVLVQHMPPVFTASLARSLNQKSALTVKEAEDDEILLPDTVYIAPGGQHLTVVKVGAQIRTRLLDTPPVNSCRPAVDVLFESVTQVYGKQLGLGAEILAVILTGMGSDGCKGVRMLKEAGATCYTQSEASCVVYGMPRAVDEAGLSDRQIPLAEMAQAIEATLLHKTGV